MSGLVLTAQMLIAIVLAVSSFHKVRSADAFSDFTLAVGELVPEIVRAHRAKAAGTVAAAEVGLALTILTPPLRRPAAMASAVLLGIFTVALARAVRRGQQTPCRCFGRSSVSPAPEHLLRNGLLILLAGAAAMPVSTTGLGRAEVAISAYAAIALAIALVSLDDLRRLLPSTR